LVVFALLASLLLLSLAMGAQAGFTFVPDPAQPLLPPGSRLVTVADLSGFQDLVIENAEADTLGVMLGDDHGDFSPASSISVPGHPAFVQVADFNEDGYPDLLVGLETKPPPTPHENTLPDHVEILLGDGHGNFTPGQLSALPEIGPIYVGDFNGDGHQDLLLAPDGCWGGVNSAKYYMLLGDGRGDLSRGPTSTSATDGGCASLAGDFTGDGRDDLVTRSISPTEAIVTLPGQADGTLGPAVTTPQSGTASVVPGDTADLNGDGKLDLVIGRFGGSTAQIETLIGNGAGAFEAHTYAAEQSNPYGYGFVLGDFNVDGHIDVATLGSQLAVLTNNGAGLLSPSFASPPATGATEGFAVDVNGDGRPDLVLSWGPPVRVLLNEPAPGTPLTKAPSPVSLRVSLKLSRRPGRGGRSLRVNGRLVLGAGLSAGSSVCSGHVLIALRLRGRALSHVRATLSSSCSFSARLSVGSRALHARRAPTVLVSFGGNAHLRATSLRQRL
jgi:FG-GAP-like repeat